MLRRLCKISDKSRYKHLEKLLKKHDSNKPLYVDRKRVAEVPKNRKGGRTGYGVVALYLFNLYIEEER